MTPAEPTTPILDPNATVPSPSSTIDLLAEPTFEECVEEWNRYIEDRDAKRITLRDLPEGHHLAYYGGQIHDHDTDRNALQNRVAEALGVHWARVVIDYPWMW